MEHGGSLSSEGEKVKHHLEVNKIKFKQHATKEDTFLFMSGVLEVVSVEGANVYKFNGVEIKFNEIRDAVTLITPTQNDINKLLDSLTNGSGVA